MFSIAYPMPSREFVLAIVVTCLALFLLGVIAHSVRYLAAACRGGGFVVESDEDDIGAALDQYDSGFQTGIAVAADFGIRVLSHALASSPGEYLDAKELHTVADKLRSLREDARAEHRERHGEDIDLDDWNGPLPADDPDEDDDDRGKHTLILN